MSARPAMLDEIEAQMQGAAVREVILPVCCFKTCGHSAAALLSLGYTDGKHNVYALCLEHVQLLKSRHPSLLAKESHQGVFLYCY